MLRAACVLATTTLVAGLTAAPLPETDPFTPGTRWAGLLTQKGKFRDGTAGPPAFRTVLTVTARDSARFEGSLAESADDIRVTYQVKGTIVSAGAGKGYLLRFHSTNASGAVGTTPVLDVPYVGVLNGKSVRGTWHVPTGQGYVGVEGDFELELTK